MPNEVEIRITSVDRSGPGFDSAIRRAHQLAAAMQQSGNVTNHVLNSITQNANQAGHALHNMGQQGQNAGQQAASGGDDAGGAMDMLGKAGGAAGAAIAAGMAVATAAIAGVKKELDASIERANVGALIAAQTGKGMDSAGIAHAGRLAGKVYADNFGDSLQTAGNAVRDAIRSGLVPADAGDDAIKQVSEKLLTLGTIAEEDTGAIARSISQILKTGLADNATEAFDVLTVGFQNGTNAAGDLLDTFTEYSTQFRKLGLDAEQAMGLLSQGLRGGARDADLVADALKEFSIRAVDGSKLSAEGFKALGLDAAKMTSQIASGGKGAADGLQVVLEKLRNIQDPVARAAAATALFGTQSEDLGDALYSLDVSSAVRQLGDVAGAADKAGKALGGGLGNQIETFKRKAQQMLADVGDKIAPFVGEYFKTIGGFAKGLKDVFAGSTVPSELMDSLRQVAKDYLPALKDALSSIVEKVRENKESFITLGKFIADYVIPLFGYLLVDGLKFVASAIGNVIDVIGFLIEAWQKSYDMMAPILIGMVRLVLDFFGTIVNGAAKAFGWIPNIGPKLSQAANEFNSFANKVNAALDKIDPVKDIYIQTHFIGGQGQSRGGEYRTGGIIGGMSAAATGGVRQGLVKVGEEGEEFARLPTGTMVYPHANTKQMQAMAGSGGGSAVEVRFTGSGALWELFMEAQRTGAVTILKTAIN